MCYIINKKWNTLEACSKDSSVLTCMNNVLNSVSSYCIHNDVQSAVVRRGNTDHYVLHCFTRVCLCARNIKTPVYVCVSVFLQQLQNKGSVISHHLSPSITNSRAFPFPQGCEWLKAWDISVILQWFRNGPNVKWYRIRLTAPDWVSRQTGCMSKCLCWT